MPQRLYLASPSRLYAFQSCPRAYRFGYLDRPRPQARPQRAHTSVGLSVHNVLRDFWDLPADKRTPQGVREALRAAWIPVGFRDDGQSARWRQKVTEEVIDYLRGIDRDAEPRGIERTVSLRTDVLGLTGRVDRIDERGEELVIVDYKTSRRPLHPDSARTSLALAFYAAAASRLLRRPCFEVELHHIPSGEVIRHRHTAESLDRKLAEADSIARDARRADQRYADLGPDAPDFAPTPSALCRWCDYRAHCPEGQREGPEQSDWAALEPDERS
ncbi:PD-(D/E)XK nuclease family protein [Calidifontibacter sp. DB0510]|uniref:PD-(D/E)XK nuclease family protein n=2 Tax=Metallococcus carri TaxID=1656884 RepID=A0A967B342_9MICO|nr:PD-(D/E)XK nuclease family protein [Metallococcus carri]NOP36119.1 PD-(D/E)XK nuclease family protein [Calidifontibacter sp. DB2511S]